MRQRHSFTMRRSGVVLLHRIVPVLLLILGAPAFASTPVAAATFFGNANFQQQYEMGEAIVANFWGPLATAQEPQIEAYAEGQAGAVCKPMQACPKFIAVGRRLVQYFDKARMEQNTPGGPVTNGLLAVELITGRVQVGDTQYDQRQPATIAAVGDPTNTFPTYADFAKWQMAAASGNGPVTTLAQPDGSVGTYMDTMNDPLTKIGTTDMVAMHGVPLAFSQFRDKVGLPTVGLAITEPFWVQVKVAGVPRVVLTQAFERRVLTYTPDNPDPYKVEFGNIGAHYYQWRYPNGVSGAAMGMGNGGAATPSTIPTTPGGGGGSTMMGPAPRSLPLPAAPSGFALRGVHDFTAMDGPPIRVLFHPNTGALYVMTNTGNLFQIDRASGMATFIVSLKSDNPTPQVFYAADFGPDGTFFAVRCLQPTANPGQSTTHTAEILRVSDVTGSSTVPTITVLNQRQYPGGDLRYNHEVTSLKYGPDGMLYIGAGSHTDHGELDGGVGEVPETSAVFRISPTIVNAPFELFADGIRNPFGAAFRPDGKLFIADHGPQKDYPEKLNYVQQGRHYGFPYRFGNNVPNPDGPPEPLGLTFTAPIPNTGPDSLNPDGLDSQNPSYTFLPHSAPGGLVFYSATTGANLFPMSYRGDGFLVMYGNLERSGETRGFSVLRLTLSEGAPGDFTVSVHTFLSGLRRPTDVAAAPDGALIVLESSGAINPTDQTIGYGRVLEVMPA